MQSKKDLTRGLLSDEDIVNPLVQSSDRVRFPSEDSSEEYYIFEANVQYWITQIYYHWLSHGFLGTVTSVVTDLLCYLFLIFFTGFLFLGVDWDVVFEFYTFEGAVRVASFESFWEVGAAGFFLLCLLVWLKLSFSGVVRIVRSYKTRNFCLAYLNLSPEDIATRSWNEVMDAVVNNQRRVFGIYGELTHMDFVNLIMLKENYMIALMNSEKLNLKIPIFRGSYITKTVEWALATTLSSFMYSDEGYGVHEHFYKIGYERRRELANNLKFRFVLIGIISLALFPLVLVGVTIFFFFRYGEQLKNNAGGLASRMQWSTLAKWRFRDFNELPHFFEHRLNEALPLAKNYSNHFSSFMKDTIFSGISFLAGSFAIVLMVIGFINSDALLDVSITIFGVKKTLIELLGIFAIVIAFTRKSPNPSRVNAEAINESMMKLAEKTHFYPPNWRGKAHLPKVKSKFSSYYKSTPLVWLMEYISIITTPFVLLFSLRESSDGIVDFIVNSTVKKQYGDQFYNICKYSLCEVEPEVNEEIQQTTEQQMGKLGVSILNFQENYPEWNLSDNQTILLSSLETPTEYTFTEEPINRYQSLLGNI
eukprot:TRINITY_DN3193_c0_g1_i1.p1 TRINITY_DN3193_c0_g1~~TRINITY_DN3193_c0_g1_i1.p1  ORF type:complete len:604 (+),score=100.59 TRINITY_DN3193_c0_g1_i1:42-1814(+)